MSTFRTAVQRRVEAEAKAAAELEAKRQAAIEAGEEFTEPDPNDGKIAWPDTEEGPFFFTPPTPAQLGLLGSRLRDNTTGTYTAFERLTRQLLSADQFLLFLDWIERGDLALEDLVIGDPEDEVEGGLLGLLSSEASGRPTRPSTASSETPTPTGLRSTGRVPSKVSTPSS